MSHGISNIIMVFFTISDYFNGDIVRKNDGIKIDIKSMM
jgi:hypothetical protein